MPTPSNDTLPTPPAQDYTPLRSTCPPEDERQEGPRAESPQPSSSRATSPQPECILPPSTIDGTSESRATSPENVRSKRADGSIDGPIRDTPSPMSVEDHSECDSRLAQSVTSPVAQPLHDLGLLGSPFPSHRFGPNSFCSFLRPGSKFHGKQESDRQKYDVEVVVKNVDMENSTLCGYLRIQGLTEDHPTLTTFFEGEVIGNKYTFQTRHPEWGSNERVDMQHWNRFPAWRPLAKQAKHPDFSYKGYAQREHIFMRWKEHFLVPDHRIQTINGASFEGFYYICFNQKTGHVSGIYFHARSEKFQQLELDHVDDRGRMPAFEFR